MSSIEMMKRVLATKGSIIGFDIGGTLYKGVVATPPGVSFPEKFGFSGRQETGLTFTVTLHGKRMPVQFLKGETVALERVITSDEISHALTPDHLSTTRILTAGGGAHKFRGALQSVGVELVPFKEMQSLVQGLNFLSQFGPEDELFTVEDGMDVPVSWPPKDQLYPFILVSMGSGVSVVRVNSEDSADFERVGGTGIGGATFLGLTKLLTHCYSFSEAIELAMQGDATNVDKLVGDIYGEAGCKDLGLPPRMTAANFGKLVHLRQGDQNPNPEDIARALLQLVVQASCIVAKQFATQAGCLERVFIVGGFVDGNPIARSVFSQNFSQLSGRAIFARHSDFLGALGCLAQKFHEHEFGLPSPEASWKNEIELKANHLKSESKL